MKRFVFIGVAIFGLVISLAGAGLTVSDLGMGVSRNLGNLARPLQTGQTTKYATGDDGDLELGLTKSYWVYTTGQYSGTTNITINGKTHALSNNCVRDARTGLMWARYVPTSDIGPAADGKLFWEQWALGPNTDISFTAGTKIINSVAGDFDTNALCVGRKVAITGAGEAGNNQTVTVTAITANNMTVSEAIVDEVAGASVSFATVDDLIWDALDQANANALGGYTDWRVPNYFELPSIVNLGNCGPAIDTTVFPSTPNFYHWTSSTNPCYSAYAFYVYFNFGLVSYSYKTTNKYYVRFVRG